MDFVYLAIISMAFFWPSVIHIYEPPGLRAVLFIGLAVSACFLAGLFAPKKDSAQAVKSGFIELGAVILVQGAIMPFYYIWAARVHEEFIFAPVASAILNLSGISNIWEGPVLRMDTYRHTAYFLSAPEKAGYLPLLLILAGGFAVYALRKEKIRRYMAFAALVLFYGLLRYAALIMMSASFYIHSMFWEWSISFISFIPLIFISCLALKPTGVQDYGLLFKSYGQRANLISAGLFFLVIFSAVSFFGLRDYGRPNAGRVLVDEYHSDWEWTTEAYDTNWFGERSGYNYYCFFDFIDKYYTASRNMSEITEESLENIDVFIMKTPTLPFLDSEIQAMLNFVAQGGGLYLIGDHTNVFGTSTNINPLVEHFGFYFNHDCTYELADGTLSEYDAPKLLAHPGVQGLPHFLFATSCTLKAAWQNEEIMTGYGLKNFPVDYSQRNFFPEETNGGDIQFGLFLQSAGAYYGKGRVLAYTDSTVYSNFWMYMPSKPELLLLSLDWLNHENTFAAYLKPRELSLILMAACLAANIGWIIKRKGQIPITRTVLGGIMGLAAGLIVFTGTNLVFVNMPEPSKPMTNICFEREYSNFQLPDSLDGFLSHMSESLSTFYVWTQRLGYYPETNGKLKAALSQGNLAVMAKPDREIKNTREIIKLIENGGKLLILDHMESGANANSLLREVGMAITDGAGRTAAYGDITDIPLTEQASIITGGNVLMADENGGAILAVVEIGEGFIAVFSDPDLMYSMELGDVSANLNEKTEKLSMLDFKMMTELVEGTF